MMAVVAIEIPIDPPMLRSMLARPVAAPMSLFWMVAIIMVDRGTKTKLRANPVTMIGISSV